MKIALANDHRGYRLKEAVKKFLAGRDIEAVDVGTSSEQSVDYPDYGGLAAEKVSSGECDRGIVICGSGIGMCIVANKYPRVRCALCHDVDAAEMSRKHNNCNVLSLAADKIDETLALKIVRAWLETEFEGGRHQHRIDKITTIENR
jgi:ribose 5-phosphate isomerase B